MASNNFDIHITPEHFGNEARQSPHYRISVTGTPVGEVDSFVLPFELSKVMDFNYRLRQELVPYEEIKKWGQELYGTIFTPKLHTSLARSLDSAQSLGNLCIRLHLDADDLLWALPWELLYEPLRKNFLSLLHNTPIVRTIPVADRRSLGALSLPLKMLVVIVNSTMSWDSKEAEWQAIQKSLADMIQNQTIDIRMRAITTLQELQYHLRQEQFNILHLIGAEEFQTENHNSYLSLLVQPQQPFLRLIMLTGQPHSSAQSLQSFSKLTRSLLENGVPAVVAAQFPQRTRGLRFIEVFYEALKENFSIHGAIREGRIAVFLNEDPAWAIPFLTMRSTEDSLFEVMDGLNRDNNSKSFIYQNSQKANRDEGRSSPAVDVNVLFSDSRTEEQTWSVEVFVPPQGFDLICGLRPMIIFGDEKTGKTAIAHHLAYIAESITLDYQGAVRLECEEHTYKTLLIEWRPQPLTVDIEISTESIDVYFRGILDACALTIFSHIMHQPENFNQADTWSQDVLVWFVHSYLCGDIKLRTANIYRNSSKTGRVLWQSILDRTVIPILEPDVPPHFIIRELLKSLKDVGLACIYIIVDDLSSWQEVSPALLNKSIFSCLSALALFGCEGFTYKLLLPNWIQPAFAQINGFKRHRVDVMNLHWSEVKLIEILLRRLTVAVGHDIPSITHVCEYKSLTSWLKFCAGSTPSAWIRYFHPIAKIYERRYAAGNTTPLTKLDLIEIYRRFPPEVYFNREKRQWRVGLGETVYLVEDANTLLAYLHDREGQVCLNQEIYSHLVMMSVFQQNLSIDEKEIRNEVTNIVSLLRQSIEPDPELPLYIIAHNNGYSYGEATDL